MFTYLVVDPVSKTHYVGSTNKLSYKRPWSHLDGNSHNAKVNQVTENNNNVFVFVSTDDYLETKDEEQFYLDFYHGSRWCLNVHPLATGYPNSEAIAESNRRRRGVPQKPLPEEARRRGNESRRKTWRLRTPGTREFSNPEQHRQNIAASHDYRKANDPAYFDKQRRGQRAAVLSKVGFQGLYPEKLGYRTHLSADFVNYYTHFGKW